MSPALITAADLRWLACPVCHHPLELTAAPVLILCTGCARLYPIVDNLPILLAIRSTTEG